MSNLANGINFRLSSLDDFENRSLAERVIRTLLEAPSYLVPKRYGRQEPLKSLVNPDNIEPMIDLWVPREKKPIAGPVKFPDGLLLMDFAPGGEYLFHWKKHSVPSFAGGSGSVPWPVLREEPSQLNEFLSLVKRLIGVINPVYGDIQNMELPGWDMPFDLQKRLPDVPWISVYGSPYIQMFGEDKILSAPFFRVEKLSSGHFWLQSSESVAEPISDTVRSAIRKHFGEDSFMAHPKWRYKDGKAPQFDFSNSFRKI